MKKTLISLAALGLFTLLAGLYVVRIYNGLIDSQQCVVAQWAQVQNVYQRRADLIPNLVNTVAGAANFEKSTLIEVTDARASVGKVTLEAAKTPAEGAQLIEFEKAQGRLTSALSRLLVVSERYPELHATANFATLQVQLEGSENRIAIERGRFNESTQLYNSSIKRVPEVFIAAFLGFHEKPYFAATSVANNTPVVKFDLSSTAK